MKIGIITFWTSNGNYGQQLQCYALQKYLRNQGHDAFLIRYIHENDVDFSLAKIKEATPLIEQLTSFASKLKKLLNPYIVVHFIYSMIKDFRENNLAKINIEKEKDVLRDFETFRNENLAMTENIYNSYAELKANPPKADLYIAGSDQIWNFVSWSLNMCKNNLHAHFLDFGDDTTKRASYAASFGKSALQDDFIKEITPLLQKFDFVSVREFSGIELCKQCGCANAEQRIDPTLLLDASHYRELYQKKQNPLPQKKYIVVYYLRNACNFYIKSIYKWAKQKNLEVVYITSTGLYNKYPKTYATIEQWLELIDKAEYVITNSFHGSVFSLIFNKKFAVAPLTETYQAMNTRIDTLFKLFNIKSRWFTGDFAILDEPMSPVLTANREFDVEKIWGQK